MAEIVLVTGGSGGIGGAVCKSLADSGWTVVVGDREVERAERTASTLKGEGHCGVAVDVSDERSVVALFDRVENELEPVRALVCCAGLLLVGPERPSLTEISVDDWRKTHDVNALGTFLCCREYVRRKTRRGIRGGRIVTMSSVAAELGGYRSSASYISSKAAILGLTKAMARELAPMDVTVNCIAPGVIDAPMFYQSVPEGMAEQAIGVQSAAIPLQRLGTREDVAGVVSFLVSEQASYMTGATVDVNGGYYMG